MFQIITDKTADLPESFCIANNIKANNLSIVIGDEIYDQDNDINAKLFYEKMREGHMPKTSQVNPEDARYSMLGALKESTDILYIACSSNLSGSYQSAFVAANIVKDERPDANIVVIDSLSASMGQGLLVYEAVRLRNEGKSFTEVCEIIKDKAKHSIHCLTVEDLKYLQKGGRLGRSSALIGSIVGIKPLIKMNEEGKLIASGKVRGRKKSLNAIVDMMEYYLGSYAKYKNEMIAICHGDCQEDAEYVEQIIHERLGMKNTMVQPLGPATGAHGGPGTVALFFFGESREEGRIATSNVAS